MEYEILKNPMGLIEFTLNKDEKIVAEAGDQDGRLMEAAVLIVAARGCACAAGADRAYRRGQSTTARCRVGGETRS